MSYLIITGYEEEPRIAYAHTVDNLTTHLLETHPSIYTTVIEVKDGWPHVLAGKVEEAHKGEERG